MMARLFLILVLAGLCIDPAWAGEASGSPSTSRPVHVLCASDYVHLKVYQEDDLETKVRIASDGTASFPLIGVVAIAGKTVEQAAGVVRELYDKDYLVNPQVTLSVLEYAKRRFTVLGQVQKPGSYEMPDGQTPDLLQAIAMAGGFTRLANPSRVTVTRVVGGKKATQILDAKLAASDPNTKAFEILPDDTITVAERFF